MAAYKAGCDTVIIPKDNSKDLKEISDEVKAGVEFITVQTFDEVINYALEYLQKPDSDGKAYSATVNNSNSQQGALI